MGFDDEELAAVVRGVGMSVQMLFEPLHNLRGYFWMVSNLQSDDALVTSRRIAHDVAEVAVERQQHRVQLLSLGYDDRVGGIDAKVVLELKHVVAVVRQCALDERRE